MSRVLKPIFIAAVAVLAASQAAHADQPLRTYVESEVVSYSDLNIASDTDAKTLLTRLEKAAWRVCGGDPRNQPAYKIMPFHVKEVFRECREGAVARAVASVDEKSLWQVFASSEDLRRNSKRG